MYCILAVVYFLLVVLLSTLSETYQLWVLLVPFFEACLSATLMQYTDVECKVKIKRWRKILLELLRWTVLTVLLYRWFNVYSIVVVTS